MTDQPRAYRQGYADRAAGKPMAESFTMPAADQNHYVNGYRDACNDQPKADDLTEWMRIW